LPSVHYRHHTYVPWKLDKPRIQRRHPGAKERWAKPLRTKTPAMAGCNKGTLPVGLQAPQVRRAAASFNLLPGTPAVTKTTAPSLSYRHSI